MTLKAQIKWTDGYQFVARAGTGPAVVLDSTDGGSGPTPMDMLLMGVAGCSAIDVVMIMQKKRAKLTDFHVNISGTKADADPQRFTHINLEYVLYGKGIKPSGVEQAIRLSEEKYCSAMASVNAEFSHTYRIVEMD
ncbi:OsmC family protein [Desulfobacterales bacterium HSG17]|nr:OsmC family protein [Desulfobacterales bacterium HSG17]